MLPTTKRSISSPARAAFSIFVYLDLHGRRADVSRGRRYSMVEERGSPASSTCPTRCRIFVSSWASSQPSHFAFVHRLRACETGVAKSTDPSVPSNHAAASAAIAFAFLVHGMRREDLSFLAAALVVMTFRSFIGTHYASDAMGAARTASVGRGAGGPDISGGHGRRWDDHGNFLNVGLQGLGQLPPRLALSKYLTRAR